MFTTSCILSHSKGYKMAIYSLFHIRYIISYDVYDTQRGQTFLCAIYLDHMLTSDKLYNKTTWKYNVKLDHKLWVSVSFRLVLFYSAGALVSRLLLYDHT